MTHLQGKSLRQEHPTSWLREGSADDTHRPVLSSPLSPAGFGLPDDVVIEQRGKGDTFVDCTGADVKISNIKFVQHDAVEGILSKYPGISCI